MSILDTPIDFLLVPNKMITTIKTRGQTTELIILVMVSFCILVYTVKSKQRKPLTPAKKPCFLLVPVGQLWQEWQQKIRQVMYYDGASCWSFFLFLPVSKRWRILLNDRVLILLAFTQPWNIGCFSGACNEAGQSGTSVPNTLHWRKRRRWRKKKKKKMMKKSVRRAQALPYHLTSLKSYLAAIQPRAHVAKYFLSKKNCYHYCCWKSCILCLVPFILAIYFGRNRYNKDYQVLFETVSSFIKTSERVEGFIIHV